LDDITDKHACNSHWTLFDLGFIALTDFFCIKE
jgi:hypothetical protein